MTKQRTKEEITNYQVRRAQERKNKIIEEEEVKDTIQEMSQNQNVPDMSAEVEELSRKELHEDKLGDHKLTVKFQNTRDEDERV